MLGAITGDIVGSIYEFNNIKTIEFEFFQPECFFTDDTVLTVSLADVILNNRDYASTMREYYRRYPNAGYGMMFMKWAGDKNTPAYQSWGNGAAMRISPVGYAFNTLEEVLRMAEKFTLPTHGHPEGIKGAKATASAIFLAELDTVKSKSKSTSFNNLAITSIKHVKRFAQLIILMNPARIRFHRP